MAAGLGASLAVGDGDGVGTIEVVGVAVGVALGAKLNEMGASFVFCAVCVFQRSDHGAILIKA